MSMEYIRKAYGVPAKRGCRVEYSGRPGETLLGTILSSAGAHLVIKLDGESRAGIYHPTWELRYLEARALAKEHTGTGGAAEHG